MNISHIKVNAMKLFKFMILISIGIISGCGKIEPSIKDWHPLGSYVSTNGCTDGSVEVLRFTADTNDDLIRLHKQVYKCDIASKTYTLEYGEFDGPKPISADGKEWTPEGLQIEGLDMNYVPPKSSNGEFSVYANQEKVYRFNQAGNEITQTLSSKDKEVLAAISGKSVEQIVAQFDLGANESASLKKDISRLERRKSPQGDIAFRRFATGTEQIAVIRSDLHNWFNLDR